MRGPRGVNYGSMLSRGNDDWQVSKGNQMMIAIGPGHGHGLVLAAAGPDGRDLASASIEAPRQSMVVQVNEGSDPLLILICMLAAAVLSPSLLASSLAEF